MDGSFSAAGRMMHRAYRLRCYPTQVQAQQLARMFGTARFVWNWALRARSGGFKDQDLIVAAGRGLSLSGVDLSRELTTFKREPEFEWICETPSCVLQQKLRDQDTAFAAFFAGRGKYPRFKKKLENQSIRFTLDQRQGKLLKDFTAGDLRLPGLKSLKVVWSQKPSAAPKMVTVTRGADGRYFISFAVEEVRQAAPVATGAMGIDVGIKDLLVCSDGQRMANAQQLRKKLRYLRRAQRTLSRKTQGSHRYRRQKQRVARIHSKISDSRSNAVHQATTRVVRSAQIIGIEDLNVKGMLQNRRLARSLSDASLGEIHRQLAYKSDWSGRTLVKVGRWYASSKTCSVCGAMNEALTLRDRQWCCASCGIVHDRDLNAAHNIEHEALRILAGTPAVAQGVGNLMRVEGDTNRRLNRKTKSTAPVEPRIRQISEAGMEPVDEI